MDSKAIIQLIIIAILLFLSAFFSSAETALTTVNRISLKALSDAGDKKATLVLWVLERYSKMLSTILICNNIVNIVASALVTSFTITYIGNTFVTVSTAVLTVFVLIFGEITPKNVSMVKALQISLKDAPIIKVLMFLLTPAIIAIDFLAGALLKLMRIDREYRSHITENELKTYVEAGHEDGVIESGEKEIIYNVFDFGDAMAKDIMVPRIDMVCLPSDASYEEALTCFKKDMFTRIPIYSDNPDNIIGLINIKDFILIEDPADFNARTMLRAAYFTYEYKKTADLLKEMRAKSFSVAFVMNEYGSTVGMITLEDLVEEIVGEIRDEYDEDEQELIHQYDDQTYLVEGSMKLDDVNDALGCNLASENYDSIGGLMIEQLDRLPKNNELITLPSGTTLQAKGIKQNRIVKVLMRCKEKPDTDPENSESNDETM